MNRAIVHNGQDLTGVVTLEKKSAITKTLAVAGTVLAWLPILATAGISIVGSLRDRAFRFDWLMPAELFPVALAGGGLLMWAALRARSRRELIGWGLGVMVGLLAGGQALAVATGLASGKAEPSGWIWALVVASIAGYSLALVEIGVSGLLLVRGVFRDSRNGDAPVSPEAGIVSPRVVVQVLFFVVVVPFLPLLISRRWDWWEAWVYAVAYILSFAIGRALVARRYPDLLAERARFLRHESVETWDRLLAPLVALGGGSIPLVAGLDALSGPSHAFDLPVRVLSLVMILAGSALGTYALLENRFFSGMVRIQAERDHRVVSSGPYRWVRHPGYAGAVLAYLATPLFLDAPWALLPAVFLAAAVVLRTELEDRALQDRLQGYRDYARRVRYRLLPGVW